MLRHIALVSQTNAVDSSELAVVGAALQRQVARDLSPIWNVEATVDAFPRLADVPPGYYAIIVRDDVLATKGAKGVHHDPDKQPFALVQYTDEETWPVFASHECLEMLVDPGLGRLIPGPSLKPDQGRVEYLLEVCDPCQDPSRSYTVNGVRVSDFYTPRYFDPVKVAGVQYSFAGSITGPREVCDRGYVAWVVPETGEWWMGFVVEGKLDFTRAGPLAEAMSVREFIDSRSVDIPGTSTPPASGPSGKALREAMRIASAGRAQRLQDRISKLLGQPAARRRRRQRAGRRIS
jgi:hypothetical protein